MTLEEVKTFFFFLCFDGIRRQSVVEGFFGYWKKKDKLQVLIRA